MCWGYEIWVGTFAAIPLVPLFALGPSQPKCFQWIC